MKEKSDEAVLMMKAVVHWVKKGELLPLVLLKTLLTILNDANDGKEPLRQAKDG